MNPCPGKRWYTDDGLPMAISTDETSKGRFTFIADGVQFNGRPVKRKGEFRETGKYYTHDDRRFNVTASFAMDVCLGIAKRTKPVHSATFALILSSFPHDKQPAILRAAEQINGPIGSWKNVSEPVMEYLERVKISSENARISSLVIQESAEEQNRSRLHRLGKPAEVVVTMNPVEREIKELVDKHLATLGETRSGPWLDLSSRFDNLFSDELVGEGNVVEYDKVESSSFTFSPRNRKRTAKINGR